VVICLERGADAYGTVDDTATHCLLLLVPAHLGSAGQGVVKRVRARARACVCVCVSYIVGLLVF